MKKILTILILTIFLTGCTQVLKADNKPVLNPSTNQSLTKNIICQPKNEAVQKLYEKHKVNYQSLPACEELKVTFKNNDTLWTNAFIRPLATLIMKISSVVGNVGLAVILTGLLIRIIFIPVTKKTASQSENMKKAKPDLDALEKKYKNKTDQESLMKKNQEMMVIYKKYQINPVSGCLFAFIQLPIFFAFFEAINRVPALFEGKFLTLNLGMTPLKGISNGDLMYLGLVVLLALVTYYSFNFGKQDILPGSSAAQNKVMLYFLLGIIVIASFNLSTAILLYWVTSSGFTIVQNIYVARGGKKKND
jgi:YidC/Oxa1 family membrane protein insertase